MPLLNHQMRNMLLKRERSYCITRHVSLLSIFRIATNFNQEKLLANGDKWEPELAAVARADAPYR
jgi:hypothetical protein